MQPRSSIRRPGPRSGPHRAAVAALVTLALGFALVTFPGCGSSAPGSQRHHAARAPKSVAATSDSIPTRSAGTPAVVAGADGSSGAPGSTGDRSAAATDAVLHYVDSLVAHDAGALAASADDGPLAMGGVIVDIASIDSDRGATTTVTAGRSSLVPVDSRASSVTLNGSVTLTTTIAGPKGSGTFTDTVSGPVVVADEAGTWKVTSFVYDGRSVDLWPEQASQTVNGLHVAVGYVVSYGALTAVLLSLGQESGAADVQLQTCTLRTAAGSLQGFGDFTGPPTPAGVLRFTRTDAPPKSLALEFTTAAGQSDDFTLPLS